MFGLRVPPGHNLRLWLLLGVILASVVTLYIIYPEVVTTIFQSLIRVREKYGVNPWIYGFLWVVVSAFPYWGGFHLFMTGLEIGNKRRQWKGIALNRFGVALAPLYVLVWGHGISLPLLLITQILIPVALTAIFLRRLRDGKWREAQNGLTNRVIHGWHFVVFAAFAIYFRLPPVKAEIARRLARGKGVEVRIATSETDLAAAFALEQRVFEEENYPYEYGQYNEQSTVVTAWLGDQIAGVVRLIGGRAGLLQPFLTDCQVWDERWQRLSLCGQLEELGTAAVDQKFRGLFIAPKLYREAFANLRTRGITHLAIIEEPTRVARLSQLMSLDFIRIGPIGYQPEGYDRWDCGAFVSDLTKTLRIMRWVNPTLHRWFAAPKIASSRTDLPPTKSAPC